jgi:signal transduction histidine kinase
LARPVWTEVLLLLLAQAGGAQAFQLVDGVNVRSDAGSLSVWAAAALSALGTLLGAWWFRERRVTEQRRVLRALHSLSEDIIAADAPGEIAEKLSTVLPTVTRATSSSLYLYNRRTKSLERVPTATEPDPMAAPLDAPPEGLANAAVISFRNRTLLSIPDVRRNPLVQVSAMTNLPRSAIFAPLAAGHEVLGVLEVASASRVGYFSPEEQAAVQHLANQVGASLKLQQQQAMREQLFRSEKLAATGQLISGVANELRAPLASIAELAAGLAARAGQPLPDEDLARLAAESQRASEIVSRLVSFAGQEESAPSPVDVNALLASLVRFREPEWRAQDLRVHNKLGTDPAPVLGARGQLEQVFLNLLVHAEQRASEAPLKTIAIQTSVIATRIVVEINYALPTLGPGRDDEPNPLLDSQTPEGSATGLGVCQGIVRSHGGEIRFQVRAGSARFEVDLPIAGSATQSVSISARPSRPLTLLLVEPDSGAQRQLFSQLGVRGHRVVPSGLEQAGDLVQRLRFDAVLWTVRSSGGRWSDFRERAGSAISTFVLISDAYDKELARSLEESGGFLLAQPIDESELDRILGEIAARAVQAQRARTT